MLNEKQSRFFIGSWTFDVERSAINILTSIFAILGICIFFSAFSAHSAVQFFWGLVFIK